MREQSLAHMALPEFVDVFGHIAGLASAVTASVSTVVSLAIAAIVGNLLDGTVMPVLAGYALSGAVGSALLAHGRRGPRHPAKTPV